MIASPERTLSTASMPAHASAARAAAALVLGFGALAFAAVGWSLLVLPSLRTLSPDQYPNALRLSSVAPLLLGAGAAHALAAYLALGESVLRRRLAAAIVISGAVIATVLGVARLATGSPDSLAGSIAAAVPLLALAVVYVAVAASELTSTRSQR